MMSEGIFSQEVRTAVGTKTEGEVMLPAERQMRREELCEMGEYMNTALRLFGSYAIIPAMKATIGWILQIN